MLRTAADFIRIEDAPVRRYLSAETGVKEIRWHEEREQSMKFDRKSLIGLAVIGCVAAVGSTLRADDDDAPPTSQPAVSLEREMQGMSQAFRLIRKQVSDPSQNASTLATVLELEKHTLAAKSAVPHSATTMPTDAQNADKLHDYQTTMLNVLRQELDLEEQLRSNDNEKAAATVASIHDLETAGHKEFRPRRKRD